MPALDPTGAWRDAAALPESPARQDAVRHLSAAEAALDDLPRAERQAAAAFAILSQLDGDADGRNFALLLRALWMILRSRCRQGRLKAADEAFHLALPFLAAAPPVSAARAMLLAGVAQLRWAQRRLDEAAALFSQAARMFRAAADRRGEAACRAQAAWVLVEQADPSRARAQLARAQFQLDSELAPALAARIALVLAWCNFATGRAGQARECLRQANGVYDPAPPSGEETLRRWWMARIAVLSGEADQADGLLDVVRRRLLAVGSVAEAARSSLDLLVLRVDAGRTDAVSELGPDLLRAFVSQDPEAGVPEGAQHLLRNQRGVNVAAATAWRPAEMIHLLATLAQRRSARFAPSLLAVRHYLYGLRTHPRSRPDLILDVQDLADPLLIAMHPDRNAGAGQGTPPEGAGQ
jgi:hypothetical protein